MTFGPTCEYNIGDLIVNKDKSCIIYITNIAFAQIQDLTINYQYNDNKSLKFCRQVDHVGWFCQIKVIKQDNLRFMPYFLNKFNYYWASELELLSLFIDQPVLNWQHIKCKIM